MAAMVSRTGRQNQLYHNGCRLVAGCIPYRLRDQKMEVLVVKTQKSDSVLFPKGGWENDETVEEAALREAMEEAGVEGIIGEMVGIWTFSSKGNAAADRIAHMFPLRSPKLHDCWPEMHRERIWMSAEEARKRVKHQWMAEALDKLMSNMGLATGNGYPNPHGPVLGMPMTPSSNKVSHQKGVFLGLKFIVDKGKMAQKNLQKPMVVSPIDRLLLSSAYTFKLYLSNNLFRRACFSN